MTPLKPKFRKLREDKFFNEKKNFQDQVQSNNNSKSNKLMPVTSWSHSLPWRKHALFELHQGEKTLMLILIASDHDVKSSYSEFKSQG